MMKKYAGNFIFLHGLLSILFVKNEKAIVIFFLIYFVLVSIFL